MSDHPRVQQLLFELLDADASPEEVCEDCPELIPAVRDRWRRVCLVRDELDELFPVTRDAPPEADDPTSPGPPGTRPAALAPGASLGDYRIVREVGRGAMGVVYEAVHTALDKQVALKVLPAEFVAGRLDRFMREARIAAGLHHTNIVPVFDVGMAGGVPYYAMQFIPGRPLTAAPDPGTAPTDPPTATFVCHDDKTISASPTPRPVHRLPPADAARYALQVAEGLAYAHDRGVVHRDVKPGNLLLDPAGVVWIADFGLAFRADDVTLTKDGAVLGTPRYMAPEQARGENVIDARADVYALGVTLYELLTGRPALPGRDVVELLRQAEEYVPPPPRSVERGIPRDLDVIVEKAIAKRPADRYQSARALADDLKRFLAGEPIKARRISLAGKTWRWARRNPAVASLLTAVLIVFAAGALASGYYARLAGVKAADAEAKAEMAAEKSKEARRHEAEALLASARGTRLSRRMGQRFDALAALKKAAAIGRELELPPEWFAPLRNEAVNALALPDLQIAETFPRWEEGSPVTAVSPDLEWYAQSPGGKGFVIRRLADGTEVFRAPDRTESVLFGTGRRVALMERQSRNVQVWNLAGPTPVKLWETANVYSWNFSLTGDRFAVSGPDGAILVRDLAAGTDLYRLPPGRVTNGANVALHPTAPYVAVCSYHHREADVRDLRTGKAFPLSPAWAGGGGYVGWHPDGKSFVLTDGNAGRFQLYDFDPAAGTARLRGTVTHTGDASGRPDYNPAGDRFVSRGWYNVASLHDAASGRELFRTTSLPFVGGTFDPTGRRIAAVRLGDGDDRIGLLAVGDGRECRSVPCPKMTASSMAVPVAGGRLLAAQAGPDLVLVSPADGRVVARIPFPGGWINTGGMCTDGLGRLLVNAPGGFYRWPVEADPADPDRVRVGPPEKLPFNPGNHPVAASRDGRVVAQSMWDGYSEQPYAGGWILNAAVPGGARRVGPAVSTGVSSVSPDGRFVAFAMDGLRVFDAATREEKWHLPKGAGKFTPDGKWLATWGTGGRLFAVGTWEPGPKLGEGTVTAISPDGKYAVLTTTGGLLRYVEVETGRELVRFEDPDLQNGPATFSPDGATLYTGAADGFRVWDLRLIRRQLAEMGLDWDAEPFPPAAPPAAPVRVDVVGTDLLDATKRTAAQAFVRRYTGTAVAVFGPRPKTAAEFVARGRAFAEQGWHDMARADFDAAVARDPRSHPALAARGVEHLRRGDWAAAAADFTASLAVVPDCPLCLRRRGRSNYELGRFAEAAADFERGLQDPALSAANRAAFHLLRADALDRAGRPVAAAFARATAAALTPNLPLAANNFAWPYLTADGGAGGVPSFVPRLARSAVSLAPDVATYHNTLGVALYRTGKYADAKTELETSQRLGAGKHDAWDLYVLAMCRHKLGDPAAAKADYDKAVAWQSTARGLTAKELAELAAFKAEASQLLGR